MGKTAVITGSAGFVGRHMTRALLDRGWDVWGWDIAPDHAPGCGPGDAFDLFHQEDGPRYDLVVHCAAQAPHRAAIDGMPSIHAYNAALDAELFRWAVRTKQRRVLYFSSSAVYPIGMQESSNPGYRLAEEDAFGVDGGLISAYMLRYLVETNQAVRLEPDGGYGRTKMSGEWLAGYARAAGVPVTVVRPFSGYGSDQGEDWPFGAFLGRAVRREDPFQLWNGSAVRDWVHVSDVVAGALAMVEADVAEPVNLCTGRGISARDVAAEIAGVFGHDGARFEEIPGAPQGVAYRVGDPSRQNVIYQPRVSLEEGVWRAFKAVSRGE